MKSLLFDYGGTLDSDGTTWIERFYLIYKEYEIKVDRKVFDRAFYDSDDGLATRHSLKGLGLEQTIRLQVHDVLSAITPDQRALTSKIVTRFTNDCRQQFSRLRPVLDRLSQRYQLGIVSNFYGNLDDILHSEGLRSYFGVVADSGVLGVNKPDAAIFLHAAQALKTPPHECLMVGDSVPRDIVGAVNAGMKNVLISPNILAPKAGQNWTIGSVAEIESIL